MKQQFVVAHTVRQTDIPVPLDSLVTNGPSGSMVSKRNCFSYFRKNVTYLSVGPLRICQVFLSPVKLCIVGLLQIAFSCTHARARTHTFLFFAP